MFANQNSTQAIDFRYGYVFAGCNVIGFFLIYFFVIEGQGRTLEELDTMYILGVKPWKSQSWEAPPPEEISKIRREAGTAEDAAEAGEVRPAGAAGAVRDSEDTAAEKELEHHE